ncbi:hypothetical protein [Cupriavidus sp. H18C1]|uniref:hypothetical protein n=1 Tax=Cupriavidus sp. H18C1 TaxID=3241601 RepID=UPI003BB97AED
MRDLLPRLLGHAAVLGRAHHGRVFVEVEPRHLRTLGTIAARQRGDRRTGAGPRIEQQHARPGTGGTAFEPQRLQQGHGIGWQPVAQHLAAAVARRRDRNIGDRVIAPAVLQRAQLAQIGSAGHRRRQQDQSVGTLPCVGGHRLGGQHRKRRAQPQAAQHHALDPGVRAQRSARRARCCAHRR